MMVRWRIGTDEDFPEGNVITFDYTGNNDTTPQNGALFSYTFQNLNPETTYVVQIEGRNRLGTANTHFVMETGT